VADKPASIAIIGAGIGGAAAALNLLRAGFDVQVYEQARTLRAVGAGIQISPNASRIIHYIGLGDALAELGVAPGGYQPAARGRRLHAVEDAAR
jgi:salicylate hydroxylase